MLFRPPCWRVLRLPIIFITQREVCPTQIHTDKAASTVCSCEASVFIFLRSIIVKCDLDDKSSKYSILLVQAPQTSDLTHSCVSAVSYIISSAMERNQGQNIAVEILIIDKVLHIAQHDIQKQNQLLLMLYVYNWA